ncbi:MAG: hypothetical protein Fur0037_12540 [Planctomycetota bacterium]
MHGLFRSAMELEPPASMFHGLGCEVWLAELRNHGGSGRAPFTGGLRESEDVLAVVRAARDSAPGAPLVLFGVSFGAAAASLAAPRAEGLSALVLDAPMADFRAAAGRMLSFGREGDGRSLFRVVDPWKATALWALERWSSFDAAAVRPIDSLRALPAGLPALVIAGGKDDRMPVDVVRRVYEALPMPEGTKEFWLEPSAGHGKVWTAAPLAYERRLAALLDRLPRRDRKR